LKYFDGETKAREAIYCDKIADKGKLCLCGIVIAIYYFITLSSILDAATARINARTNILE